MASWTTKEALAGLGGERLRRRVAAFVERREREGGYERACAVRGLAVSGEFSDASPSLRSEHVEAQNRRWLEAFHKGQRDEWEFDRRRLRLELLRRIG